MLFFGEGVGIYVEDRKNRVREVNNNGIYLVLFRGVNFWKVF